MLKIPSDLQHMNLPRTGSYMGSADMKFGLGLCLPGYGRPGVWAMDWV